MLDEFAGKRQMVSNLLGALKKDAGAELSRTIGGDSKKKQVTHTPVPTESVAEHTHNKESYKAGASERKDPKPSTSELNTGETPEMGMPPKLMNNGGMASPTDEPQNESPADTQAAEGGEDPKEEMTEGPIEEQDEENNSSAFSGFLKKKKK